MSETLTFEEKKAQVAAAIPKDDKLTDEEEFNIIENKGIEYILKCQDKPDLTIYIAPLKIAQYRLFYAIDAATRSGKSVPEVIDITAQSFSQIFGIPQATLEDYLDRDDIEKISTLLGCGVYMGKGMFKKKKVSLSEAKRILVPGNTMRLG